MKHAKINTFLLATFLLGVLFVVFGSIGFRFDIIIVTMLLSLPFACFFLFLMFIKLYENPEKEKARLISTQSSLFYKTDEAKERAGKFAYILLKKMYPISLVFISMGYMVSFILRIIEKVETGLPFYTKFSFMLGALLFLMMVIIIVIGIFKKERIFASENIRKYIYIYLNIILSFILIVK